VSLFQLATFAAVRILILLFFILSYGVGHCTPLQVSQVVDTPPTLTVFVNNDEIDSRIGNKSAGQNSQYLAALSNKQLNVSSVDSFLRDDGVAIVIAVDVSASLGKKNFLEIKNGLIAFLSTLKSKDQVALIAIGSGVRVLHEFTDDLALLRRQIDALEADAPETALYEAILVAQDLAAKKQTGLPMRRAVLVVTDGIDDSAKGYGKEEALKKIALGEAPVFSVGITALTGKANQRIAIKALAQISRESGGQFEEKGASALFPSLKRMMASIGSVKVLKADCSECEHDGVVRRLQVSYIKDNEKISESRDIRLMALTTPAPTLPSATASASTSASASVLPPEPLPPKIDMDLVIGMAILLILLVAIGATYYFYKKQKADEKKAREAKEAAERLKSTEAELKKKKDDSPTMGFVSAEAVIIGVVQNPNQVPGSGRAITIDITGRGKQVVYLSREIGIGRASANDINTEDDIESSSEHASIYEYKGKVMVRDLGSANGTYLNGTRIATPEPLSDGDWIVVGRTEIRIYFQG
jgi:VWFA-related protein